MLLFKAAINQYFPPIYYKFGALLAPLSLLGITSTHLDYDKIMKKVNIPTFKNDDKEEEPQIPEDGNREGEYNTD